MFFLKRALKNPVFLIKYGMYCNALQIPFVLKTK
jgi:hypothetical protein